MQFLTPSACIEWCNSLRQRKLIANGQVLGDSLPVQLQIILSRKVESDVALTLALLDLNQNSIVCGLFWLHEWDIVDPGKEFLILERLRYSFGDTSPIHLRPGILFANNESQLLQAVGELAVIGLWNAMFVPDRGDFIVEFSHDGLIAIFCLNKTVADSILVKIRHLDGISVREVSEN